MFKLSKKSKRETELSVIPSYGQNSFWKKYFYIAQYFIVHRVILLVTEFFMFFRALKQNYQTASYTGRYIKTFFITAKEHKKPLTTLFNYLCPTVFLIILFFVINHSLSQIYALEVVYNEKNIGIIENESTYLNASTLIGEIIVSSDDENNFLKVPKYKIIATRPSKMIDSETLSERIITNSNVKFEDASGVYVDGKFVGALKNQTEIETILDSALSAAQNHYGGGEASVKSNLEIRSGFYLQKTVLNTSDFSEILTGSSVEELKKGDYISNSNLEISVRKTESYETVLKYEIEEIENSNYMVGDEKITTEGKTGLAQVQAVVVYVNGEEESRTIISQVVKKEPVNEIKIVGSRLPQDAESLAKVYKGKFIWPVDGGYISSYFMSAERENHKAIDIAAAEGTDIYASADGVVTLSGVTDDGAGLNIKIDHSDGFSTRYAHCSALYVAEGMEVKQGQIIAAVGRTGNATGNHLHFEIRYNGYQINPLPFIK